MFTCMELSDPFHTLFFNMPSDIKFFRTSHSITGCIEAPIQLIMTSFLIMKGIIDLPWEEGMRYSQVTLSFNNQLPLTNIPMWTLMFSIVDILKCSLMTNVFNVYIGHISNMKDIKKYINLIGGHLPFLVDGVLFGIRDSL